MRKNTLYLCGICGWFPIGCGLSRVAHRLSCIPRKGRLLKDSRAFPTTCPVLKSNRGRLPKLLLFRSACRNCRRNWTCCNSGRGPALWERSACW